MTGKTLHGKVTGVSLGPGDPELITLKGLMALQLADKIYYPGSVYANGEKVSYSVEILKHYKLDGERFHGFYLEMNENRQQANEVYLQTASLVIRDVENGLNVVIVSEGDLSTYSSFSYLLEHLLKKGLEVDLVPGITSFGLAAALAKLPLGLQNEPVIILPRVASIEALEMALKQSKTVVLLKIRSVMPVIERVLEKDEFTFLYCERLGTNHEFITREWKDVINRTIPYFSLIILKK